MTDNSTPNIRRDGPRLLALVIVFVVLVKSLYDNIIIGILPGLVESGDLAGAIPWGLTFKMGLILAGAIWFVRRHFERRTAR